MKKVVNSVLASALAASFVPAVVGAEEAPQSGTTQTEATQTEATQTTEAPKIDPALEKVVKRLQALGLVAGYGNGEFGVDRAINRAEFATLVVRARGLEEGAKLAQFQANFTDVKPSDWFAGYVNVAAGQDIVKGYTDKSFKPANNVTYAESVAMIIRALGYDVPGSVSGVWPNNYISKAAELGISKGVKIDPNKPATRGDIFLMLDNALRVDLMKQIEYGTDVRYEVAKNKTLLTEYLDVQVRDMDWANSDDNDSNDLPFVSNVPVIALGDMDANEVELNVSRADLEGTGIASGKAVKFHVADGIDPNAFAGQHVQVWIKDGKEDTIVWMEASEDEDVINDRLSDVYYDGKFAADGSKIKGKDDIKELEIVLDGTGKTYKFADNVAVTYNFKRYGTGDGAAKGLKAIYDKFDRNNFGYPFSVKVVLNENGEISYISVVDDVSFDQNNEGVKYGSEVIEKVDTNKKKITNLESGTFDLSDKEEGKDFLVFIDGKPAKLADLKPLDVYAVYYADGDDDKPLIFATRQVVEGKVDKVEIRSNGDNRLKIGDTLYRVRTSATATASYSEDGNKTVDKITVDEIRDLDGEDVKLYLDPSGRVRHVETKDDVTDRKFNAIVTKSASYDSTDDKWNFTVLSEKGKKINVSLEADDIEDADGNELTDDQVEELFVPNKEDLMVVEITLDKDGKAQKAKIVELGDLHELQGQDWDDAADEDDATINVDLDGNGRNESYDVTSDTVVWDMTGEITSGKRVELKDARTADFKKLADDDDKTVFYTINDDDEVEFVFVVDGGAVADDTHYGYVKSVSNTNDTVTLLEKDGTELKEKEYKLDGDAEDALDKFKRFDFIAFRLNSEDQVIIDDVVKVVDGAGDDPTALDSLDPSDDDYDQLLDDASLQRVTTAVVDEVDGDDIYYKLRDENGEFVKDDKGSVIRKKYTTNSNTIFFNTDFEQEDGVNEGDYVVLIETDDDGAKFDYVLIATDEKEVKEEGYDEVDSDGVLPIGNFYKQNDDLNVEPKPPVEDKPFIDEDSIDTGRFGIAGVFTYDVKADLAEGVDEADIESVEVELDGETYPATVADGKVTFRKSLQNVDVTEGKLIITPVEGDVQTYDLTFPE
ncbi:S-layer homology domain-containing protein [Brevibacillus sp. SYP-B805]|nr:S-layer homology domain-containing protein [Brevibacillus sp. SYP-B805]